MTNQITKFQDLEVDETYRVISFKPIESKFGKSYILTVTKTGEDEKFTVFSTKPINEYIEINKLEKNPTKFDFTVGRYAGKLCVEIDGGFIKLI